MKAWRRVISFLVRSRPRRSAGRGFNRSARPLNPRVQGNSRAFGARAPCWVRPPGGFVGLILGAVAPGPPLRAGFRRFGGDGLPCGPSPPPLWIYKGEGTASSRHAASPGQAARVRVCRRTPARLPALGPLAPWPGVRPPFPFPPPPRFARRLKAGGGKRTFWRGLATVRSARALFWGRGCEKSPRRPRINQIRFYTRAAGMAFFGVAFLGPI